MRVLHILDTCVRGGAETLLLDVFKNYNPMEMDIWFCTFQGGKLENELQNSKVNFIKIPRRLPVDIFTICKLRKIIQRNKIDIVHTHILVDTLHAYLAIRGLKVKLIHSYHGYDYENDLKNNITLKLLFSRTDANIFVSKAVQQYYTEKFSSVHKGFVVYNGVDPSKMVPTGKNIRQEFGIAENSPLLGMVGNFNNTGRDQITVCRALVNVIKKYPEVHFIFVGRKSHNSPHHYDQCVNFCSQNNLSNNVYFSGARNDVPDILYALDLYVYASNHDTFGISLVEAMLCGTPVIANDLPPFLEISENGKYLELYKTKNIEDLVNKISVMIESPRNKKNAIKHAEHNFSIGKHIECLLSVYQEVLKEKHTELFAAMRD